MMKIYLFSLNEQRRSTTDIPRWAAASRGFSPRQVVDYSF